MQPTYTTVASKNSIVEWACFLFSPFSTRAWSKHSYFHLLKPDAAGSSARVATTPPRRMPAAATPLAYHSHATQSLTRRRTPRRHDLVAALSPAHYAEGCVFQCDWFDTINGTRVDEFGMVQVKHESCYLGSNLLLAHQTQHVYYLSYPHSSFKNWWVIYKVYPEMHTHRYDEYVEGHKDDDIYQEEIDVD
jgi:hypothetical protein